jgi:amino acid adenylation domain-containing protein
VGRPPVSTGAAGRAERLLGLSAEQRSRLLAELRRRGQDREAGHGIARRPAGSPAPLTLAQRRLWFLERLNPAGAGYHIPFNYRLAGPLHRQALAWALAEIARRHETLRTRFELQGAEPFQMVSPAAPPALPLADLRRLPETARAQEAARLADQEALCPFDLEHGPAWRVRLLALGEGLHLLQLTFHHIVFDAWSLDLLWHELETLYAAAATGRPAALPELLVQYGDFALWQRQRWERGEMEPHLAYWRQRLAGSPTFLALPADRPRPPMQSLRGAAMPCALPADLAHRLAALARQSQATLFMTCLAAFAALLQRWTGATDLLLGTPVANRAPADVEGLIGFFLDTLVVRVDTAGDPPFAELLRRVRDGMLADHAHQELPFERLVAEMQPQRDLSHQPLVQVLFAFDTAEGGPHRLPGLAVASQPPRSVVTAFDLILSLVHSPAGLAGDWLYGARLFEPATMSRLHARWLVLLDGIAASPGRRTSELPCLTGPERHALCVEWNDTAHAASADALLTAALARWARQRPGAPAVVGSEERVTFGELEPSVNQLARHLAELGVGPEIKVAVCVERSPAMVIGALAVLAAGGVYVPLDPSYPRQRLRLMLRAAGARVLLSQRWLLDLLPPCDARLVCLDEDGPRIARQSTAPPAVRLLPENLAYVIFTSGSTAGPKGVEVTHRGLRNLAVAQVRAFGLLPEDRILQFAPAGFDAWIAELATMVESGATLHLAHPMPLPGPELAALLRQREITVATLPPAALAVLPPAGLPRLRILISAGEACPGEVLDRFRGERALWNAYGPTETSVCASLGRCSEPGGQPHIGRPLDNLRVVLLDSTLEPVPAGASGEICIGGSGLARGYADRPAMTAESFVPDPFAHLPGERLYRSGDLARRRRDGTLEFLGRRDHQVKVRGCRVELAEVEAALREHPGVSAAVVALDGGAAAGRLAAWIVPAATASDGAGGAGGGGAGAPAAKRAELWPSVAEHLVYDDLLYHAMSSDEARNAGYRAAIERLVPGRTVVEIGTGRDAILARFCAAAGASRVYAVELLEEPWRQALERVRSLGLADRITVLRGDTRRLELPERVDVCVSEIVGPIGGCEGSAVVLNDAWRFLAPRGVMIPRRSVTRIAAAMLPDELLREPAFGAVPAHYVEAIWQQVGHPFDLRLSVRNFPPGNLLSTHEVFEELDHSGPVAPEFDREITIEVLRDGRLDGFLLWLNLETIPGVVLDILQREFCWLPVFFPVFDPGIEVSAGDTVVATCSARLCEDHLHPDYSVRGTLLRRRRDPIPFAHESYHHRRQFRANPYHARLFSAPPSRAAGQGQGRGAAPPPAGATAGGAPGAASLRSFLRRRLPEFMVPSVFVFLERLPSTPSGKIDRRALPAPAPAAESGGGGATPAAGAGAGSGAAAAGTALEARIAALWRQLLRREEVGVEESFFDLGGHSLLLAQLQIQLQPLVARPPSLIDLFAHPTVRSLAAFLAGEGPRPANAAPPPRPRSGSDRLPETGAATAAEIAIVGMAGRFPGAADLDTFWHNLAAGVESIRHFSEQELLAAGVRPSTLADAYYVRAHGALVEVERLDAPFFGFTPREAAILNPQHRLLLETAWEACEDAGYAPGRGCGRIGVFTGVGANDYWQRHVLADREVMAAVGPWQAALANLDATAANLISYKLDLTGPSLHVQTTCSTSLVAVHLACRALAAGDCELALAGAASVTLPQCIGYAYEEQGITSPDGHCRPFDAEARGTVPGSGAGMVLLKRLAEALADGDPIRAVIRGSAVNNNGAGRVGFTAPGVEEQAAVVRAALTAAGTPPSTIGYLEAHGTGTPLGDPIEIAALHRAFGESLPPASCGLGSVKSNLGHLDTAAGLAGLIKTVLALEHRLQPASLHFSRPNPALGLAAGPFTVRTEATPWAAGTAPRRAGVSSFGIGGTNAHVVLEEAPALAPAPGDRQSHLLLLSARSRGALDAATAALAAHLSRHPELALADVAYTLQAGRRAFEHRRALVCRDPAAAAAALATATSGGGLTAVRPASRRTVALLLAGSTAPLPAAALGAMYGAEPGFRAELDRCAEIFQRLLGADLRQLLVPPGGGPASGAAGGSPGEWERTDLLDAAQFACTVALGRLWIDRGIPVTAIFGCGGGELAAACLAGMLSLEEALRLVAGRARLLSNLPAAALLEPLLDLLRPIAFQPPRLPFLSATTGAWTGAGQDRAAEDWHTHWLAHLDGRASLDGPARFDSRAHLDDCLGELLRRPDLVLLEAGPGQELAARARQHTDWTAEKVVLPTPATAPPSAAGPAPADVLLDTLGRLWLAGVEVDWRRWHSGERRRRVRLPTYPFERRRLWIEPPPATASEGDAARASPPARRLPDLADWFVVPVWSERPLPRVAPAAETPRRWLVLLEAEGPGEAVAAGLEQRACEVVRVVAGADCRRLAAAAWSASPGSRDHLRQVLSALRGEGRLPSGIVHLWHAAPAPTSPTAPLSPAAAAPWAGTGEPAADAGFFSLLALAQAIGDTCLGEPLEVVAAACGTAAVTGQETLAPRNATQLGLCRVMPLEYPNLRCRYVDLPPSPWPPHPAALAATAEALAGELLAAPAAAAVVAWRGVRRWVQGYERLRLAPESVGGAPWRERGVYLLSGGLGPVGLDLAELLAREAHARLAFTSRTRLPDRAQWNDWLARHPEEDAVSRLIVRLRRLEELGAEVLPLTADALDESEMRAALAEVERHFGPLDGAIHAVGVPDGNLIQLLDPGLAATVLAPRVRATLLLAGLLAGRRLDFFVVSSSIASFGGAGLAAYCAGNCFVNAFAPWYQALTGTTTVAVGWDAWRQIAERYDDATRARLEVQLAEKIGAEEGREALRRILAARLPQVIVTPHALDVAVAQLRQLWREDSPEATRPAAGGERPALGCSYVAPRTATERRLTELWESMLGISGIGVDDPWGDLGGDSLLALQLATRIRQLFGVDLPPKAVLRTPTLAGLAALLDAPAPTAAGGGAPATGGETPSPLVLLRPAAAGRPFICAPGTGGGVAAFGDLAACWGGSRPLYGLRAVGLLDERQPLATIEAIAAHYTAAIHAAAPPGPYLLGGWSLGGTVAFEMAQQLAREGEEVALLVLLDAPPPGQFEPEVAADDATLLADVLGLPPPPPAGGSGASGEQRLAAILAAARRGRSAGAELDAAAARRLVRVCRANIGAAIAYRPRPYPGPIALVRCRIPLPGIPAGESMGWSALAGGRLDIHWVEGGHTAMLAKPGVQSLAARLGAWLDAADPPAAVTATAAAVAAAATAGAASAVETA